MIKRFTVSCIVLLAVVLASNVNLADENNERLATDPEELLAEFSKSWDDSKWENKFRGRPGYMRTSGDEGWKSRMQILQTLVAGGDKSIPALEKNLFNDFAPTRILAAQTLGYLAPRANVEKLNKVVKTDKDAAVRLYAVDALGMSGKGASVDWNELAKGEKNSDVRKHINYAKERQNKGVSESVVNSLVEWGAETIDSATVGEKAPDFQLRSVNGKEISLSQFQGKHPVVLIFIYGDT